MTWLPVSMQWPEEATSWMSNLDAAKDMAVSDLQGTQQRLGSLADQVTTDLGKIGDLAKNAAAIGREALSGQFGEVPRCITVTPF